MTWGTAPRTPVENPYCGRQLASQPSIERVSYLRNVGRCPDCGRIVNTRSDGTAKLHRMYGRSEMARRVHEWKRTGELA